MEESVLSIKRGERERIASLEWFLGDNFGVGDKRGSAMESKEHSTLFLSGLPR
jgi:hypothetical protein